MTYESQPPGPASPYLGRMDEAPDDLLAREAEAVLAEAGPTLTMAELLTSLWAEPDEGAP